MCQLGQHNPAGLSFPNSLGEVPLEPHAGTSVLLRLHRLLYLYYPCVTMVWGVAWHGGNTGCKGVLWGAQTRKTRHMFRVGTETARYHE